MRLSVQGCLILWLCLLSSVSFATNVTDEETAWYQCYQYIEGSEQHYDCRKSSAYTVQAYDRSDGSQIGAWTYPESGSCPVGTQYEKDAGQCVSQCTAPDYTDPETGECVAAQEPEECQENGKAYDPQTRQCVTECEHGMFNGTCLLPPEDNSECNSDSPDYRGELVLGYGQSPVPACGDFDQCSGDTPGQVGMVNGELRCIPEDYGVPECQGDTITVIDEYGFICEPLENTPEDEPEPPEEPNTDTDGDGEPDEYRRENDPTSVDKGLDKLNEGIGETNNKLDGTNKRLDKISKGISKSNELQDEANGVADDARNTLKEINDKLDAPEDGFNTEGLLGIPTMTETANNFKTAVLGNELIQSVGGLTEIPSHTSCPVWTIPATDYWEAKPMNVHCDILEEYRGTFSVIFMFFWTGIAIYAFLRA